YDVKGMVKKIAPKEGEKGFEHNGRELQRKMNKMVLNSSLGAVYERIKTKLSECGLHVFDIDASEERTTKKCSNCGEDSDELINIDLKRREIECKKCGHSEDVD